MQKFLVIQTAFLGDVVLATSIIEKLHAYHPDAEIDFLVRKGNEGLLQDHPFIHNVLTWNKDRDKYKNLIEVLKVIQARSYDKVINLHRHSSTGFLTAFSKAKETTGFDKNPLSFLFSKKVKHRIERGLHEVESNHALISSFTDNVPARPRLYPAFADRERIRRYQKKPYITLSPSSTWFTKQYPKEKWISFLNGLPADYTVYLLDAPGKRAYCEDIRKGSDYPFIKNLAGRISLLQSVALMQHAVMNYVNDSAPMHFASAMNAPVTAVFCSTTIEYGFGPLSDKSFIVQTQEHLTCRPCGCHGRRSCTEKNFRCAMHIKNEQLLDTLKAITPSEVKVLS